MKPLKTVDNISYKDYKLYISTMRALSSKVFICSLRNRRLLNMPMLVLFCIDYRTPYSLYPLYTLKFTQHNTSEVKNNLQMDLNLILDLVNTSY